MKEVALALTQADDMELELPLMEAVGVSKSLWTEAGMTSASAVQMQQLLVQARKQIDVQRAFPIFVFIFDRFLSQKLL